MDPAAMFSAPRPHAQAALRAACCRLGYAARRQRPIRKQDWAAVAEALLHRPRPREQAHGLRAAAPVLVPAQPELKVKPYTEPDAEFYKPTFGEPYSAEDVVEVPKIESQIVEQNVEVPQVPQMFTTECQTVELNVEEPLAVYAEKVAKNEISEEFQEALQDEREQQQTVEDKAQKAPDLPEVIEIEFSDETEAKKRAEEAGATKEVPKDVPKQPAPTAPSYDNRFELSSGMRVRLIGLNTAHRNGVEGTLLHQDQASQRWAVRLVGASIKVMPRNLEAVGSYSKDALERNFQEKGRVFQYYDVMLNTEVFEKLYYDAVQGFSGAAAYFRRLFSDEALFDAAYDHAAECVQRLRE